MRSLGSISSELCEMQRLRDNNIAIGAKDAEWQRRISSIGRNNSPPEHFAPMSAPFTSSPPRTYTSIDSNSFAGNPFIMRDQRLFTFSSPKTNMSPSPPIPTQLPTGTVTFSVPTARPVSAPLQPIDTNLSKFYIDMQTQPKQEMTPIPMSDVQLTAPMSDQMHPEATLTPSQQTVPHSPPPTSTPSASTNVNSPNLGEPDGDIQSSKKKPRSHSRGVGKIRRHRMTKEEEARFNPTDFNDLKGSTAAKSRKMSLSERDIMLHKRRLRNRQSAARSRDKQRKTIGDVGEEVDALLVASAEIRARCFNAEKEIKELRAANESLRKENEGMKQNNMKLTQSISELRQNGVSSPAMKRNGSTLRFSVSTDMLDKIIGGTADGAGLGETPGMNKIPSTLQLSFSTDKLSEIMPSCSGTLPPMPRNHSIMERLLDFANSNANGNINNSDYDSIEINIDTGVKKE